MSQNMSGRNQKTDSLLCMRKDREIKVFKQFSKILREDPDWYQAYRANIAVAFQDEVVNYRKKWGRQYLTRMEIHTISNNAARNFLNLLIKE